MAYARYTDKPVAIFPDHHFIYSNGFHYPVGVVNPRFRLFPVRFPVNSSFLIHMDQHRSISLIQFMENEGLVLSPEEELKRIDAIKKLKEIVLAWIKKVAWQRQLPDQQVAAASATILTYGSYGLGVHGSESDIDALCVGPSFATMANDFFIVLRNMLASKSEVSEIYCVKDAKVPLMRFKFNGIPIDLPYAQLQVLSVPEDLDILNPFFLRNIDETSWKSLSGVRANKRILQLVPNLKVFQAMVRCVKLWAKRRGIYGNLFGFLGGVHLAILAAFICQMHPDGSLNILMTAFFRTFAYWHWPTPVMLQDGMSPITGDATETRLLMPIRLPCSPYDYCHSSITRSTFYKIRTEFLRGHEITKNQTRTDFDWTALFEPFRYTQEYSHFVKIYLTASDQDGLGDWVGWVKSRFPSLLVKVEELQGFCDPNPTEYVDDVVMEPNVIFYWGLQPGRTVFKDLRPIESEFTSILNSGYHSPVGGMQLSIVEASAISKYAQFDNINGKESKACWRISDYNPSGVAVYSRHLPYYFVGYAVVD